MLLGLASGLFLLALAGSTLAKPQQQAGPETILWTGQPSNDYANNSPGTYMLPEMNQAIVLPADPNMMLVRRPSSSRGRKQNRLRQQQLMDRQLKSADENETSVKGSSTNNSTTAEGDEPIEMIPNTMKLPARVNHLIGPDSSQLIRTGVALLGAALGREGCDLKAACLAAAMLPPMQGRDVIVLAAEAIVPQEWRKIYEAAKKSIIQKHDCDRFTCL